mgnify:FL=1
MLTKLEIQNYILIDQLNIDLSEQFSVITGETGAGKSIIMGALGLILGDRADSTVCREASKKCFIEGIFKITNNAQLQTLFQENEIELSDELIIRREISAQGKSRAFINDTPVTLTTLKEITSHLVDLHQQFDTLTLGDTDFQRTVIDALASNQKELASYQAIFTHWKEKEKKLESLVAQKEDFEKTLSYKQHLFEELSGAQFQENELENLEQDLKFLENVADIKSQLAAATELLEQSDNPIVQQLKQLANNLETIVQWQPAFESIVTRLKAAQIEIADIANDLNSWQDKIDFDDQKIAHTQERLSLGYHLLKKHKVQTTAELLQITAQLEKDLSEVLNLNDHINELTIQVQKLEKEVVAAATLLSTKREKQMMPLTQNVNKLLHQVGMPNAKIKVTLDKVAYHFFGNDKIDILFDANNTEKFEPIKKVASGGELSRLMLCIKSLVARSVDLPTLIFDEIDTGISGEPAKQVGLLLQNLGKARQVLCITHQPQIAAKGNTHLYVYKEQKANTTHTYLKTLDSKERIHHIATMIGGDPPSKTAIDNAKELLAS